MVCFKMEPAPSARRYGSLVFQKIVLLELAPEGGARQVQYLAGQVLVVPRLLQHLGDVLPFDLFQTLQSFAVDGVDFQFSQVVRQSLLADDLPLGQGNGALDDIFQLAHVTGVVITQQNLKRLGRSDSPVIFLPKGRLYFSTKALINR